jgi:hypothetical protein
MANEASGPDVLTPPGEPGHVYYLRDRATGKLDRMEAEAAPRELTALSLDGFAELAGSAGTPVGSSREIFVGRCSVVAVFDGPVPRRERCTLALSITPQYECLENLRLSNGGDRAKGEPFDQRGFLQLLRVKLDRCLHPDQVAVFRSLKLSKAQGGESAIAAGNETFRKSVQIDALAGGMAPPEELTLNVQVYRDIREVEERQLVRCAVDVDLSDATFRLTPLPGELEAAQWRVLQSICRRLRVLLPTVPVHEGTSN